MPSAAKKTILAGNENSLGETGGLISSISALENADKLEPHIVEFVRDVRALECVSESARDRLDALIAKHS